MRRIIAHTTSPATCWIYASDRGRQRCEHALCCRRRRPRRDHTPAWLAGELVRMEVGHAVAQGNRIDPAAVTEYVRTYCSPSVLHNGFELYRSIPADASDNASLTANTLTWPVPYMAQTARSSRLTAQPRDPEAQKAQLLARIQPMVAGPISVQLVPDSGHWVPEENPDFVSSQLTAFVDTVKRQ